MQKSLEEQVVELLFQRHFTIATAESCTGGMIASRLVNVPGVSSLFSQGYITYSDDAKSQMLGVSQDTLLKFTAVSPEVAREMAEGCQRASGADVTVSVTGYAGPNDSIEEPRGLVYIGVSVHSHTVVVENHFEGNRSEIRESAANRAFELIIQQLQLMDIK